MTLVLNRNDKNYLEWLDYKIEGCNYFLRKLDREYSNMVSHDKYDRDVTFESENRRGYYPWEYDNLKKTKRCLRNLNYYKRERLKTQEKINNSLANLWIGYWPTLTEANNK